MVAVEAKTEDRFSISNKRGKAEDTPPYVKHSYLSVIQN